MIALLLFFVSGLHASIGTEVSYSRACASGQCGDWQKAQQRMSGLVVDNPDRAELLYDNGVAAFKLQEFEKAAAYFDEVTKKESTSARLKEQAHFNLGNTQVALNDLPKAIMQYEAALAIDPKDERAKHNLEKVRALLAQQQQEQKQDEQNQDGDSESKQDKQQQKQGANQDKDKQQKQDNGGSSEQQKSGDQQKQQSSQGKGQEDQQKDSTEQKDKGASQSDQQGDEEDKADGKSAGQDQDGEQDQFGNGHEDSPEKDEQKSDGHNVASQQDKKQDSQDKQEDQKGGRALSAAEDKELDKDRRTEDQQKMQQKFAPHEQWMARLLQKQDKADERANKQLIKASVDKNTAGKYGQNNW